MLARSSGGYKGKRRREPRRRLPQENERTVMLNLGRLNAIKYDLKEIMREYEVDEATASTLIASVIAKGSRISIGEARKYVREQEKAGAISKDVSDEICNVLSQFSKLR